jgi:sulfite exporter TauE/SafE
MAEEKMPSAQEFALQTGGGSAGFVLGSLVSFLGAPVIGFSNKYEHCAAIPESERDELLETTLRQSCFLSEASLRANQLNSYTAAGAVLGTLTGVVLTANAQGYEGNFLGASVGTFLGYAALKHINIGMLRSISIAHQFSTPENQISPEKKNALTYRAVAFQYSIPVIVTIFALLGYHLL